MADLMRTDVPIVRPDDSIATVARVLAESGLPGVPVIDGDELIGIVTESDIIERQADVDVPAVATILDAVVVAPDVGRHFDDELRHVLAVTARDLMTVPVYSVRDSASLSQVATLMIDRRLNPIPVVDDDLNLVGIVSRADLVRVIARLEQTDAATPVDAAIEEPGV